MVWVWLTLIIVFVVIEVLTVQLTTIWFAGGAFISMLLAIFGVDSIFVQIIVFLLISALLLVATRPIIKKHINKKIQPTNADRYIGKQIVVTEQINNIKETGAAVINGTAWTARSETDEIIDEGTVVTVMRIDGVKLIVRKGA